MDKLKISMPVIVEGKYDKIRLDSVVDAEIITTDGFGIFKSEKKKEYIRRIAEKDGVIVLTDSDGGGLVIRNFVRSVLPKEKTIHLYIPEIHGRERRKTEDSKSGLLGVEGIGNEILYKLFEPYAVSSEHHREGRMITKTDLFELGICGCANSAEKRKKLCIKASLPSNISSNALLDALNRLYTYEELIELIKAV